MVPLTITCVSCGQAWTVAHTFSIYEQQAVESCPCPDCGAYTLCCHDPTESQLLDGSRRSRGSRATATAR
ncbi:MAG TPA: hypothetical protein VKA46_08920 [Gemmataceae bacterium]|nr:hypothetical protein [Gemmataceae bacterium]